MRLRLVLMFLAVGAASCARPPAPPSSQPAGSADTSAVRRELEQRYDKNTRAFLAKDFAAIMALRTDDFHAVTPEGKLNDRADMEQYIRGFLNGIDRWISTSIDIALAPTRPRWHGYLYKREEVGIMVPVEWFSDRDPSLTGGNELMAKKKAAKKAKAKKKPAKKKKK